jgi:hypothetical protein
VTAISAGYSHTLALTSNGIWAWGNNSLGQLGNVTATTADLNTPQQNGFTSATGFSAGNFFSLALNSNGTAWAWGDNSSGQLGNATLDLPEFTTESPNPTPSVVIPLGNMSDNGTVAVVDALLALRIAVGLDQPSALELLVGNMSGDGQIATQISVADALLILREAVGLD